MGIKYDAEKEATQNELASNIENIHAFMSNWNDVAKYLLTYRKNGQSRMRPVNAYMNGWHIQSVTQDLHIKTTHIKNNQNVAYLFSGMQPRERGNDPVNVFIEGTAELIEDQFEVDKFLKWREDKTHTGLNTPGDDYTPFVIQVKPRYIRVEGFSGRRHPIIIRDFSKLLEPSSIVPEKNPDLSVINPELGTYKDPR
ncbi:MAG: hypothetical protein DK305_001103 [Chloroflexi bacterium]|jgi:general stress protein 26|nr:MAG: hypothetical protein DK305_001103 [Chloroflexota bacterium]|tara:strand:- start:5639 stop:6229 length:591 start_codon:yes stop_codon:yes gene_type:complete